MNMNQSSISDSSQDDERSDEIQQFLIKRLVLTPRRQLFEEFEKSAEINKEEAIPSKHPTGITLGLDNLKELSEFRKKHPECMSNVSRQRFERAKEREQQLLKQNCVHFYVESYLPNKNSEKPCSK